jgi:hypothetical protein
MGFQKNCKSALTVQKLFQSALKAFVSYVLSILAYDVFETLNEAWVWYFHELFFERSTLNILEVKTFLSPLLN